MSNDASGAVRPSPDPSGWRRLPDRIGLGAALLVPLFLLHARSLADAAVVVTGLAFLAASALETGRGGWGWVRRGWVPLALIWWAWLVLCSLPLPSLGLGAGGWPAFAQAIVVIRLLVFAAALEHFVLVRDGPRRAMAAVVTACAAYVAVQALWQFAFGVNWYGEPRGRAGELTGPFDRPRAGPVLARILPPAILPAIAALLAARRPAATIAAYLLPLGGVAVMVLISQRMPLVLTALGLAVAALLLPRLRPVAVLAGLAGAALVAVSFAVSPATWRRVVVQFSHQLATFGTSQYGFFYRRALVMAQAHPIFGRGFDGFRTGCMLKTYDPAGLAAEQARLGITEVCAPHPHNFYVQALTDAGWPGLVLFSALSVWWLVAVSRGMWRARPDPLQVGLFVAVLIQLWPLASTPGFFTVPLAGWFFLLLGWALAVARAGQAGVAAPRAGV